MFDATTQTKASANPEEIVKVIEERKKTKTATMLCMVRVYIVFGLVVFAIFRLYKFTWETATVTNFKNYIE